MTGRVIREDDEFLLIEVCKNPDRELVVASDDRFLTLSFVHQVGSRMLTWLPWKG